MPHLPITVSPERVFMYVAGFSCMWQANDAHKPKPGEIMPCYS